MMCVSPEKKPTVTSEYINPISDLRGTSLYRRDSFKGLFKRLKRCLKDDVKTMSVMEF